MRAKSTIFLLIVMILIPIQSVFAAPRADVTNDQVKFDFPNTATFSATLTSSTNITSVTLEYGDKQQTCGDVVAKTYPQITPGKTVQVSWTWDMRQSGSLPPGTSVWWRWRYTDDAGKENVSETQNAIWLDDVHDWQTLSSGDLRLQYYGKDKAFGQTMLDAGVEGLRRNKEQAGLITDAPVDLYVYPNYDDMKAAILYEPSWTGGMAFPEHNILIMGLSGSDANWDQNTVIHELTHILIGHFTFSCIGTVPQWLNEGLAMFSEGKLDENMQTELDQAIKSNTLVTLRSLNGGFSELSDKANLSYGQSQSVVNFLIQTYGQEKLTQLLIALRDAKPIDAALLEVYKFDTDGLEGAWRKSVGAAPRAVSAQATSQPTPTFVPTYVPVSGAPLAVTPTPFTVPTSSFTGPDTSSGNTNAPKGPPITLTIILVCICGALLILLAVVILGIVVRGQNQKNKNGGDHA